MATEFKALVAHGGQCLRVIVSIPALLYEYEVRKRDNSPQLYPHGRELGGYILTAIVEADSISF